MKQEDKRIRRRVRNSYIISTVSIAMVLFLLGATSYLIINALNATNRMRENMAMHVMLRGEISQPERDSLKATIGAAEGIKNIEFIGREQAAKDFSDYIGEDFESFLGSNPLPDSYEVTLNAASSTPQVVDSLAEAWQQRPEVLEVVYQKNIIKQISDNIGRFNIILLMFGAAMLVIALILLGNTIRITVMSRSVLINTMKLVGATRWFIMRPMLCRSALMGVCSGAIATILLVCMVAGLSEGMPEIALLNGNSLLLSIAGAMTLCGVLISVIFTAAAVNKSIRLQGGKIYNY